MDIVIFNKNGLSPDIFKNQLSYKYIEYSEDNISELKNKCYGNYQKLDATKCKIDTLDKISERNRRAAAKYLHEHELIKLICKKQVISRAYFKLYEMVYFEPMMSNEHLDCLFICEAPGGFIECVSDIRRKRNLRTSYLSISKNNDIKYDRYLDSDCLLYGDLMDINVINNTIKTSLKKFPNKLDLITADGGFDVKQFNAQEIITSKLIFSEIILALSLQKTGGMFVIKMFDMFTHNSIIYHLILSTLYDTVKIIKPCSSRNCNSERYLVCYNFHGISPEFLRTLTESYSKYIFNNGIHTLIFPNIKLSKAIENKYFVFNNYLVEEQIRIINESIKMVTSKDVYFQNLLLKIFMDKNKINYIVYSYKNILNSRIKKCIEFLRKYNINSNQFVYRFE